MSRTLKINGRSLIMFLSALLICLAAFAGPVQAQGPSPSPSPSPQRRKLPKPPTVRGFEKYSGDSSSRLIAAGATRGGNPRRPLAFLEALAYEAKPYFAWEIEPSSTTYHFTLCEGDVEKNPEARIVYQTDVTALELSYPANAPKLLPGKLYSWRVSTPTPSGKEDGPVALIRILKGREAVEIKQALTKAGLLSPKTAADKLDQAQVFENYGIWYDALRIASGLAKKDDDKEAKAYYEKLLAKLDAN